MKKLTGIIESHNLRIIEVDPDADQDYEQKYREINQSTISELTKLIESECNGCDGQHYFVQNPEDNSDRFCNQCGKYMTDKLHIRVDTPDKTDNE